MTDYFWRSLLDNLRGIIEELEIKIIIFFGSATTGKKRGISTTKDIDLIIVSDFFRSMSKSKRQRIIKERLGKSLDPIPLTTQEYGSLRRRKKSVVNIALEEERHCANAKRKSIERIGQKA